MKLFMIRHGESAANFNRVYAGHMDTPLTDWGRAQAEALRYALGRHRFEWVFTSDLRRAKETQKIALPDAQCIGTELLREFDVGTLAGECYLWQKDRIEMDRDYTAYGGENEEMVRKRLERFLTMLLQAPCENVAAFTHHGVIVCMMRKIFGDDFDSSLLRSDNGAIHVFEYTGGKWRLLAWNYMTRLYD